MELVVNNNTAPKPAPSPDSEPKLAAANNHQTADSPPRRSIDEPKSQSSQISSPSLSPLHLASPPSDRSPSISSGHSSATSHVSSLSDDHIPPETALAISSPPPEPNRTVHDEPKIVVAEVDPDGDARETAAKATNGVHDRDNHEFRRRKRSEPSILRKLKVKNAANRVLLGFRVLGFVFCLVSFSVMAADKNQGWAIDSFNRYKEFRYSMAVNVIGCAYSGLQAAELAYRLATGQRISGNHLRRYYVDFFLDQIIAYLLMSSSSSAATRVEDWQSNWGKDKFPSMASASVGLSFTAFVAMALSSLVSGYLLCTLRSST